MRSQGFGAQGAGFGVAGLRIEPPPDPQDNDQKSKATLPSEYYPELLASTRKGINEDVETLIIYELGSMKFTTQNDFWW